MQRKKEFKGWLILILIFTIVMTGCESTIPITGLAVASPLSTATPSELQCGNGIVEGQEECDDGDLDNGDGCLTNCKYAVCGDGYIRIGYEQCDDGNLIDNDGCDSYCNWEPMPPDEEPSWPEPQPTQYPSPEQSLIIAPGPSPFASKTVIQEDCHNFVFYTVQEGDTSSEIAYNFAKPRGIDWREVNVIKSSGEVNSNKIKPGEIVKICYPYDISMDEGSCDKTQKETDCDLNDDGKIEVSDTGYKECCDIEHYCKYDPSRPDGKFYCEQRQGKCCKCFWRATINKGTGGLDDAAICAQANCNAWLDRVECNYEQIISIGQWEDLNDPANSEYACPQTFEFDEYVGWGHGEADAFKSFAKFCLEDTNCPNIKGTLKACQSCSDYETCYALWSSYKGPQRATLTAYVWDCTAKGYVVDTGSTFTKDGDCYDLTFPLCSIFDTGIWDCYMGGVAAPCNTYSRTGTRYTEYRLCCCDSDLDYRTDGTGKNSDGSFNGRVVKPDNVYDSKATCKSSCSRDRNSQGNFRFETSSTQCIQTYDKCTILEGNDVWEEYVCPTVSNPE
jgi:cysteine-rich repeat protein